MNIFLKKINPNNLHHAYLIVGDRELAKKELFDFLEKELKIKTVGNPDFLYFDFNSLSIDEARELGRVQERKVFSDDNSAKKIFVIGTNVINIEAQNALLKVFEEPTERTHFFILASQNTFLPTFLSRLAVISFTDDQRQWNESFLEKSLPERLLFVGKLAGDISDEKMVKQDAIELINNLEDELLENGGVEKNAKQLKECQFARNALFSRGAMVKMILENLVLHL